MIHALVAVFFVHVDDRLRIRGASKHMSLRNQASSEFLIVIDLSIENRPYRSIFVDGRLPSGFQVDDPKTPHPEADLRRDKKSVFVRTSMEQRRAHFFNFGTTNRRPVQTDDSGNSTHGLISLVFQNHHARSSAEQQIVKLIPEIARPPSGVA